MYCALDHGGGSRPNLSVPPCFAVIMYGFAKCNKVKVSAHIQARLWSLAVVFVPVPPPHCLPYLGPWWPCGTPLHSTLTDIVHLALAHSVHPCTSSYYTLAGSCT